jgi:hypothetical protein
MNFDEDESAGPFGKVRVNTADLIATFTGGHSGDGRIDGAHGASR